MEKIILVSIWNFFLNVRIIAEQAIPFGNYCKSELTNSYFLISTFPPHPPQKKSPQMEWKGPLIIFFCDIQLHMVPH